MTVFTILPIVAIAWRDLLRSVVQVFSGRSNCEARIVGFAARQHGPDDAGIFVGEGYGRDIGMSPFSEFVEPTDSRILLAPGSTEYAGWRRRWQGRPRRAPRQDGRYIDQTSPVESGRLDLGILLLRIAALDPTRLVAPGPSLRSPPRAGPFSMNDFPMLSRQRHTRAGSLLPRVDGRGRWARRYRNMVTAIEAEVGAADLSEFDRAMIAQQVALAR